MNSTLRHSLKIRSHQALEPASCGTDTADDSRVVLSQSLVENVVATDLPRRGNRKIRDQSIFRTTGD